MTSIPAFGGLPAAKPVQSSGTAAHYDVMCWTASALGDLCRTLSVLMPRLPR
ncbi:hypothetical protein [Mycolicibacterium confluentis]|uniref:hypothetical protein n=1 Tax=Mycolicibacterium confluentis TaxID=28047 RepID=UPI0013D45DBB|nr:hypothetical protein [Mycolicibacterium confluentis]MCV7317845.1 hypothetical protein [Mycolicibacterium confluentis]